METDIYSVWDPCWGLLGIPVQCMSTLKAGCPRITPNQLVLKKKTEPVKELVIEMSVDLLKGFLIWAMYCDDVEFQVIVYTVFKSLVTE